MTAVPHELRPYAPARDQAWVTSTWRHGLCTPDAHACRSARTIRAHFRQHDTACIVAHHPGEPDELYGWCAAQGGALLWVYVRSVRHQQVDVEIIRRGGIGTALMLAAGVDPARLTPCRYWSPYAAILAQRGYRLYYAPETERIAS